MSTQVQPHVTAQHDWPDTWILGRKFGDLSAQMAFAETQVRVTAL